MKRLMLLLTLSASFGGCTYLKGTWINPFCDVGTDVEVPCYCHRATNSVLCGPRPMPQEHSSVKPTCYSMDLGQDDAGWMSVGGNAHEVPCPDARRQ